MSEKERDFDPEGLTESEIAILEGESDSATPDVEEVEAASTQDGGNIELGEEATASEAKESANPAESAPQGYVPNQALREARDEIKRIRQEQQERDAKIIERLAQFKEGKPEAEPETPAQEIPGDDDPIGQISYLKEQLAQLQDGMQEREQAQRQAFETQQAAIAQFDQAAQVFDKAVSLNPAVGEAGESIQSGLRSELQRLGWSGQQLEQQVNQHLLQMAQGAPKDPESMVDYVQRYARFYGWEGVKAKAEAPTAAQAVEGLASKVDRNKRITGGTGNANVTLDDINAMSGAELEAFVDKNPDIFASLTGG